MTLSELKRLRTITAGAFFLAALLLIVAFAEGRSELRVYFFDVGQGDSELILFPDNTEVLIDGGPDRGVLRKVGRAMPFYDQTIEYVILSHPHSDHLTGVVDVLERYRVNTFISNGVTRDDLPLYQKLTSLLEKKGIQTLVVDHASTLSVGGGTLEFLYPDHALEGKERQDLNRGSVVLRLVYGDSEFLFTGDMPSTAEDHLLTNGVEVSSDVLKVAHQGSKTSSGGQFLSAVDPDYAVIMVGKNTYGHPHLRTLITLERSGARILRTDRDGDITFTTDGRTLRLRKSFIGRLVENINLKKILTVLE